MGLTLQMRKMNPRRLDLVNWWIVVAPVGLVFYFMSTVYLILDLVNIDLVYLKTLARRPRQEALATLPIQPYIHLGKEVAGDPVTPAFRPALGSWLHPVNLKHSGSFKNTCLSLTSRF